MATYPLKNISIGGDTYQIPEYYLDTDDTYLELHRGSEMISTLPIPTVQISISSSISPWDFNDTSFTSSAVSCNMSSLQVLSGLTDNACVWVSYNSHPYIATAKSQTQSGNMTTIFESAVENSKVWQIVLVTTGLGVFVSCTGNVIDLSSGGGGGGGSSAYEVTLCDQYSQPVPIGQFDSSSTLSNAKLVNGADAKDFDAIFTTWKTAEVIINVGSQYEPSKRHFKVVAVNEGSSTSIVAVYVQSLSPRYVIFEYSGGAWNMTKN